jgi:hypothetical protein
VTTPTFTSTTPAASLLTRSGSTPIAAPQLGTLAMPQATTAPTPSGGVTGPEVSADAPLDSAAAGVAEQTAQTARNLLVLALVLGLASVAIVFGRMVVNIRRRRIDAAGAAEMEAATLTMAPARLPSEPRSEPAPETDGLSIFGDRR